MNTYNAVAGIDERALSLFVSDFYGCARQHVFHRNVPVAAPILTPLTSFEYEVIGDIGAPRIGFVSPHGHPTGGSSTASFELWVDHFTVTLHYAGSEPSTALAGSVHATADLVSDPATAVLVPRLTSATVDIPDEKKLTEIFNQIVSPHLDQFLQEKLLDPIRVPAIRVGDVTLNGPTIATSEDRLLITAALPSGVADPAPLDRLWPDGRVFVAADFVLVNALAALQVPKIGTKSGEWKKTIKFGIGQSTIKASYSATVKELTLAPVKGQPTQIEGTVTIDTSVTAKAKNLFNVSGAGVTKATVTAEAFVNDSRGLGVRLTGLKPFSIRFSFPGGAGGFAAYVETMANAASAVLQGMISAELRALPPLEVGTLPSFDLPIDDHVYGIQITEPAIRTIEVAGRTLLSATGVPDVVLST